MGLFDGRTTAAKIQEKLEAHDAKTEQSNQQEIQRLRKELGNAEGQLAGRDAARKKLTQELEAAEAREAEKEMEQYKKRVDELARKHEEAGKRVSKAIEELHAAVSEARELGEQELYLPVRMVGPTGDTSAVDRLSWLRRLKDVAFPLSGAFEKAPRPDGSPDVNIRVDDLQKAQAAAEEHGRAIRGILVKALEDAKNNASTAPKSLERTVATTGARQQFARQ
jgi:hypothetical protein